MSLLRDLNAKPVDPEKLGLTQEAFKLLHDVAILGMTRSYFNQTREILKGYLNAKPDSELAAMATGLLNISTAEYAKAVEVFETITKQSPDNAIAWSYLGLSLKMKGERDKAREILKSVKGEPSAVALAEGLLDKMEKEDKAA